MGHPSHKTGNRLRSDEWCWGSSFLAPTLHDWCRWTLESISKPLFLSSMHDTVFLIDPCILGDGTTTPAQSHGRGICFWMCCNWPGDSRLVERKGKKEKGKEKGRGKVRSCIIEPLPSLFRASNTLVPTDRSAAVGLARHQYTKPGPVFSCSPRNNCLLIRGGSKLSRWITIIDLSFH